MQRCREGAEIAEQVDVALECMDGGDRVGWIAAPSTMLRMHRQMPICWRYLSDLRDSRGHINLLLKTVLCIRSID